MSLRAQAFLFPRFRRHKLPTIASAQQDRLASIISPGVAGHFVAIPICAKSRGQRKRCAACGRAQCSGSCTEATMLFFAASLAIPCQNRRALRSRHFRQSDAAAVGFFRRPPISAPLPICAACLVRVPLGHIRRHRSTPRRRIEFCAAAAPPARSTASVNVRRKSFHQSSAWPHGLRQNSVYAARAGPLLAKKYYS